MQYCTNYHQSFLGTHVALVVLATLYSLPSLLNKNNHITLDLVLKYACSIILNLIIDALTFV